MRFCSTEVPERIFTLARERVRLQVTCTPEEIRQYILKHAAADLQAISTIRQNHSIIADRVMRAVVKELAAVGEIAQLKRGVWAKRTFLDAAAACCQPVLNQRNPK